MKNKTAKIMSAVSAVLVFTAILLSCTDTGKVRLEDTSSVLTTISDSDTSSASDSTTGAFSSDDVTSAAVQTSCTNDPTVTKKAPETETASSTEKPPVTEKSSETENVKPKEEQSMFLKQLKFLSNSVDNELCYVTETNGFVFLSSTANVSALKVTFNDSGYLLYGKTGGSISEKVFSGGCIDLSSMKYVESNGRVCYRITFKSVYETIELTVFQGSVSALYIDTGMDLNRLLQNKENVDEGTRALFIDEKGNVGYDDGAAETLSKFKCRGNSTFRYYDKKPFQLKLGKKAGLGGMDPAKTWILLASAFDKSFVRNAAATAIANSLSLPFTPDFTYVDLFINNEYHGLYILTEKVQIGKNRIEIDSLEDENENVNKGVDLSKIKNETAKLDDQVNLHQLFFVPLPKQPDDITGGYLLEIDNLYYGGEISKFTTENKNHYILKSPEYASYDEMMYISGLVCEMEEALYSDTGYNSFGRHYSEYIDVGSLAGVYIVREMMKDWDAFNGSTYLYKDADVGGIVSELHLGPIWDFDLTLNNNADEQAYMDSLLWAQGENDSPYSSRLFGKMIMSHPEMKALVAEYYTTASKTASDICAQGGYIDTVRDVIKPSDLMERKRWENSIGYSRPFSDGNDTDESTYVGQIKYRLSARAKKLTPYIGKYNVPDDYYSVTLAADLKGKVELCCELWKGGSRAAVRAVSNADIQLVAELPDGSTVSLSKSSTGSHYENGILCFEMPFADVVIKEG